MVIFSSLVSVANLVLACLLLSFSLVESRLSQLEGVRARAKVPQVYQNLDVNQQQQQNAIAVASESAVGSVANGNFAATAACADGWLNFQNMLCFYGIQQPQLTFYYGRQQCAQMGANFTSINSMDEFNFIMANFDLRRFWIGIAFGSNNFEDGTPVDQQVVREWAPLVPWSDPSLPKGFICKAFANMQMQSNGQSSTK